MQSAHQRALWTAARFTLAVAFGISCGDPTSPGSQVASVQITAVPTNPRVGQNTILGATPVNSGGVAVQGVPCTMTSGNPAVLSLATDGAGWKGLGVSAGTSVVTATCGNVANTVTITVRPPEVTLTVTKTGNGSGNVTMSPAGGTYDAGTLVTLTASPSAGSAFTSWSGGGCSGSATTCAITLTSNQTVTARFDLVPQTYTGSAVPTTQMGTGSAGGCTFTQTLVQGALSVSIIVAADGTVTGTSTGTSTATSTTSQANCTGSTAQRDMTGAVTGTTSNLTITATGPAGTPPREFNFVGTLNGNTITGTLTIKTRLTITDNATGAVQGTFDFQQTISNYTLTKQ